MTEEERAQRGVILPHINKTRTTTEMRLAGLELDASAQRTAILRLERNIKMLAGAVVLGPVALLALLEVLT
jgi:hypothetical protein